MNDARQALFISGTGGNCSHRALHGKCKNQQVCWSTCVCFLWVYMCSPLHLCTCVSIRNEGPARANERCWETVIETLRRAGDGIWARWCHSKRKKHTPCAPLFAPRIQAACFSGGHGRRGRARFRFPLFIWSSYPTCQEKKGN